MKKTKPRKILFIRGFNTDQVPEKHYAFFDVVYNQYKKKRKKKSFAFFRYSNVEDIRSVYARLLAVLREDKHDVVMAHSMGCFLFVKYMSEFPETLHRFRKIVLFMPLISKVPWIDCAVRLVPFAENVSLFVPMFLSTTVLGDDTVIVNDFFATGQHLISFSDLWVPAKQVVQCYNDMILSPDEVVEVINGSPQCTLFHASDELVAPIDPATLAKIRKKVQVQGKHECFNDSERAVPFFAALAERICVA